MFYKFQSILKKFGLVRSLFVLALQIVDVKPATPAKRGLSNLGKYLEELLFRT